MAKKKSFLKFNEFVDEQGIQKCQFCGNELNVCSCSSDKHDNVRFKQYEPTSTGASGPIEKQIIKTKEEKNE